MAFTSPYGIGYGLGATGAGAAQGLLQGRVLAPQLQYENLRNQMLQTQIGNQQAEQQALSQMNPNQIQPGQQNTPLDQPVSDAQFYIQQLRQRGQGIAANQFEQNLVQLQQKQRGLAVGKAAQEILYGDPQNAKSILNGLGFNIQDIQPQQDGSFNISAGGQSHNLSPDEIAMIAADPSQLPNVFYRKQLLGLRGQAIQQRQEANWNNYQARLQQIQAQRDIAEKRGQYQLESAQTQAGGRIGAARASAAGALERMKLRPDVAAAQFMTDQLGMTPDEANASLQQAKQTPRGIDQVVETAAKQHPEWSANDVVQFRKSISDAMGGQPAAPPVPRRPPVKPRAAGGLPPELNGAPPQVIQAYNAGKEITLPSGKKLKK